MYLILPLFYFEAHDAQLERHTRGVYPNSVGNGAKPYQSLTKCIMTPESPEFKPTNDPGNKQKACNARLSNLKTTVTSCHISSGSCLENRLVIILAVNFAKQYVYSKNGAPSNLAVVPWVGHYQPHGIFQRKVQVCWR